MSAEKVAKALVAKALEEEAAAEAERKAAEEEAAAEAEKKPCRGRGGGCCRCGRGSGGTAGWSG